MDAVKNASLMHGELRVGHQWKNILILRCVVSSINGLVCFHLSSLLAGTQSPASFISASFVVKLASGLYVETLISAMLRRPSNFFFQFCAFSGLYVASVDGVSGFTCLSLNFFIKSYSYWSIFVIFGIPNRIMTRLVFRSTFAACYTYLIVERKIVFN